MYKTISFPRQDSGTGEIERLRLGPLDTDEDLKKWICNLNSKEIRALIKLNYSDLQNLSEKKNTALSTVAMTFLEKRYLEQFPKAVAKKSKKDALDNGKANDDYGAHGTFRPNHMESIHRWYPYLEGFSSSFVKMLINKWHPSAKSIYDPFAGTGTTLAVATSNNMQAYYSEINPFMRLVVETKTNSLKRVSKQKAQLSNYLKSIIEYAQRNPLKLAQAKQLFSSAFSDKPYFQDRKLVEILSIKNAIFSVEEKNTDFKNFALLALGSIAVHCSEMKRAADLRYRTEKERLPLEFSVYECYQQKITDILQDISPELSELKDTNLISYSVLDKPSLNNKVDLVLTSPPYLNGTNYFRNTKIELWITGLLNNEKELGGHTRAALCAGINNVSKNGRETIKYSFVERIAKKLDEVTYDVRIPSLVRMYCSDTEKWLTNCYKILNSNGKAIIDIGDSKFAGIHVPTDIFLEKIAIKVGFEIENVELVRSRNSKDGTPLKQVVYILKKGKK